MTALAAAPGAAPTRVLIVDDHPILRHGIAQLVAREPDFAVTGEAGSVAEALAVLAGEGADLMVVDLSLERESGLALIRRAKELHPGVRTLVLSMHDERLHAERAIRAGARGYVMKQEATRRFVAALRAVRGGAIYLSETMTTELLGRLTEPGAARPADTAAPAEAPRLSDRELQVLQLIAQGLKTGEIARALNRSVHTVEAHRASIKRKLGLRSAGELTKAAFEIAAQSPPAG